VVVAAAVVVVPLKNRRNLKKNILVNKFMTE
jgi:hypothetical protein